MPRNKYWRLDPAALDNVVPTGVQVLTEPAELVAKLRPQHGIVLAHWDEAARLGQVHALGRVVRQVDGTAIEVEWHAAEIRLRPNPSGRRYWRQSAPYFGFATAVAERYMLDALFAEAGPLQINDVVGAPPASIPRARTSHTATAGFVYVVKSPYGYKIGKTVHLRDRTRLFAVKLPFPISIEHYAQCEDYTRAEREFHQMFHAKRLEGEWFDLDQADLGVIRSFGQSVDVPGVAL